MTVSFCDRGCLTIESLDRKHPVSGIYFGDLRDSLWQEVMRSEDRMVVWNESDAVARQTVPCWIAADV